ncbi:hypothetical protein ABH931_004680 [Streptacidiphilus sp. MAP12-33]|uniref:hypothetical protein n=1 Tax=Streptacidiphilus sp. MAP12-33 TaxID=3156266 RepID=UPI0035181D89
MDTTTRRTLRLLAAAALLTAALAASGPAPATAQTRAAVPLTAALILPDGPVTGPTPVLSYHETADATVPAPGRPRFSDLTITRYAGDTTTTFLRRLLPQRITLQHGAALTLTPAGQAHPRMEITLSGVTVTSDEISGNNGGIPVEKVTLGFVTMGVEVFTPNGHGGYTESQGCSFNPDGTYGCPLPLVP